MLLIHKDISCKDVLILICVFGINHFLIKVFDVAKVDLPPIEGINSISDGLELPLEIKHGLPLRLLRSPSTSWHLFGSQSLFFGVLGI